MRQKIPVLLLWLLALAGLLLVAVLGDALPAHVASHFDWSGRADGWIERASFLWLLGASVVVLAALFTGIAWLLPRTPDQWISLEHKDYWLASPRRESTLARLASFAAWVGATTQALILILSLLVVRANRAGTQPPRLGWETTALMVAYGSSVFACVHRLMRSFTPPLPR